MNEITDFRIVPLVSGALKTFSLYYTQDGKQKTWDLLMTDDTAVVLVYNTTRNVLVFVKQFRPAVYYNSIPIEDRKDVIDTNKYPAESGITLELCTRTITNQTPIFDQVKDEIRNTLGYNVSSSQIQKIASYRSGVGTVGSRQTAFYCEVTDDMKTDVIDEDGIIEIVEMSPLETKKYVQQKFVRSPPNYLFGVYWFLYNKTK